MGCHFLLQCMKVKSESEVDQLCPTLSDPWAAAYQAPLSMGFSRQEYWSGVPSVSPIGPHNESQLDYTRYTFGQLGLATSEIAPSRSISPARLASAARVHEL